MTARAIITLLKQRHSHDVFVPECKDGPTCDGGHHRLDGWAMKRSWSNPLVVGYEIKVTRSDFLQDDKWPYYLPMCNQLYFVCPWGLIQPPEVPSEVGLLWASRTGTRLYTKAKAAHRDVEIPESVWRYVLMCRSVITREHHVESDREYWLEWLKQRKLDRRLGRKVGKAIRQTIDDQIIAVREENEKLETLIRQYDGLRDTLRRLGLNPDSPLDCRDWNVENKVNEARRAVPKGLIYQLGLVAKAAETTQVLLKQLEERDLDSQEGI